MILLYSVLHKSTLLPSASFVQPILVGAKNNVSVFSENILRDDTGLNISELNPNFCELTALFWIWKNGDRSKSDIWGLCHYRRYFTKRSYRITGSIRSRKYFEFNQANLDKVVNDKLYIYLNKLLNKNDIIIQCPVDAHKLKGRKLGISAAYSLKHSSSDWQTTIDIVLEKYPSYADSIHHFNESTTMSYYNMMIASWQIWDNYLEWLFNILFELQKRIIISCDSYQSRVFGFLGERLMNLYIEHNNLKKAFVTIALFEK